MGFEQTGRPTVDMRPVALLTATPEELSARGVRWGEDQDDLDAYVWAAGRLDGAEVGFARHANSPETGVVIYAPEDGDARELADAATEAFGGSTVWVAED